MKRLTLLPILFVTTFLFGQTTNLIISEYGEGSGGNKKYIEIYNGTGSTVNLANYKIQKTSNGSAWADVAGLTLSGTLANGAVYVIANNAADVPGGNQFSANLNFNGDDAVGLAWNGGSGTVFNRIDAVGEQPDPGTGWAVAGIASATEDKILIRKPGVCSPNMNWDLSRGTDAASSEWIIAVNPYNNVNQTTDLGMHTSTCAGCNTTNTISVTVCETYTVPSGDETHTTSGTYMDTIPNAANCDSVITINLTIKHATTSILTVSNCGPYTLNSQIYNTSGTYMQTLPGGNATGCDSTITLNLSVVTTITYYADTDTDGFGDLNNTTTGCTLPVGYVTNSNDCNDNDNTIGAATTSYYIDADGDSFGNGSISVVECTQPMGYVTNNSDCDDNNNTIGVGTTYYVDADGDGYGTTASTVACSQPVGYATVSGDCDDNAPTVHPGATEIPNNGIDDDCAGGDLNTIGTQLGIYEFTGTNACPTPTITVTAQPANAVFSEYTTTGTTCSPAANVFNYSAWNVTPTIDLSEYNEFKFTPADCHTLTLTTLKFEHKISGSGGTPFVHIRSNLDNFAADVATIHIMSTNLTSETVTLPAVFTNVGDTVKFRFYITEMGATGATYRHDNVAVIGYINALATQTYYVDADGDSFGSSTAPAVTDCVQPTGYVLNNTDCNDTSATINPNAIWYEDLDGDSFGNPAVSLTQCAQPAGYVTDNTDCNDNDGNSGSTIQYFADTDHDGYGDAGSFVIACAAPTDYVTNDDDCDDNDNTITVPTTTYYVDADGDGFGAAGSIGVVECTQPSGHAANNTDCNDNSAVTHPGAAEICDNIDNDCDGSTDEGLTATNWYHDADNDGFGNAQVVLADCSQPTGYVVNSTDCDDNNAAVHPGATEVCDNLDNDCDGSTDEGITTTNWFQDVDGDGFGNAQAVLADCSQPTGYVANNTDCNDANPAINPNATDVPGNGIDENCDLVDGTLGIDENNESSLVISPNPGSGYMTISLAESWNSAINVTLLSTDGKQVAQQRFAENAGTLTLSTQQLLPGVYLVQISDGSRTAIVRWMKH